MKILGNTITYSVDMILFVLSIFRFTVFVKIFSFWYIFTSDRSTRLYNLLHGFYFSRKINWGFSFRITNKYYNLLCLVPIFMFLIYLYALVFKIFEDFDPEGEYTRFNNIYNCLWFILVTMTTIGYGDYTPVTMVGRMIIVTCCIIGVFMISLIFSSFVVMTDLENSEQNAFEQIEYFYMKDQKKDEYQNYILDFIRYKLNIKKRIGLDSLIEKFKLYNKKKGVVHPKFNKENSENKVLANFACEVCKSWEKVDEYLINFSKLSPDLITKGEIIKDEGPILRKELKSSQKLSFQIYNLVKFNNTCGGLFEMSDIEMVNSKNMIQSDKLIKAVTSFLKVYSYRKICNNPVKENGNSNKYDEFFDIDNFKKIVNRSAETTFLRENTNLENNLQVKSSIIKHNSKSSIANDYHNFNTNESKPDNIEALNSLGIIDEELSDWDN